jgi:hypothetical protein
MIMRKEGGWKKKKRMHHLGSSSFVKGREKNESEDEIIKPKMLLIFSS